MKKIQVVGAIILKNSKLLAAQRASNRTLGSLWEFPGGKIEPGESPEAALARELSEEFGASATIFDPFFTGGDAEFDFGEIVLHCYYARLDSEITKTIAHDELRWVSKTEAKMLNWAPSDVPVIKELTKASFTYEYRR